MLLKVAEQEAPHRLVVVFDAPEATFRHTQYAAYKAQRAETPDDFRQQVPYLRDLLERLGVPVLAVGGFEADDTLGTLAVMGAERGFHSLIVTGDRDLLQLVGDSVTVLLTARTGISDLDRMDRDQVKKKMGVWPEQIPDLKGLMGDGSDNIPGVAGIGQKSALALIDQYASIENLLQHLGDLSNTRWKNALLGHEAEARQYRDLATIVTTVPIEWPAIKEPFQWTIDSRLADLLNELELTAVKRRLKIDGASGKIGGPDRNPSANEEKLGTSFDRRSPLPAVTVVERGAFTTEKASCLGVYREGETVWLYNPHTHTAMQQATRDALPSQAPLAGWGIKALYREAWSLNREMPSFKSDVKLAAYLLDSERRDYSLEKLLEDRGMAPFRPGTGESAAAVAWLAQVQHGELTEKHMQTLYQEVELPLARLLARMESVGVAVDRGRLEALGREVDESMHATEQEIFRLAGDRFNINSQRQLGEILFDRLGLPPMKRTKTGHSTDAETLEALKPLHPIVSEILLYRQLMKIHGTYVEGLLPLIQADGRIHTTFHQTVAATGRLSSSDPNLQNIPIRLALGRRVRSVFVPSPGHVFLAADYSQIELRVLAHLAQDENLIQAFCDGEDIHRRTASEIFNIPIDQVDSTWRSRAKAVNFGIIYGISDFGLARDTGVSRAEAREYIDRYYARYPALKEYFEGVVADARRQGFVSTILGRRRPLPDIESKNRVRRQYAERMAMNTAIQGSAADLIKVAMLRIDEAMADQEPKSQMILQVHDELIWDAEPSEVDRLARLARQHMVSAIELRVPLVVDFKRGQNWENVTSWDVEDAHA